MFTSYDVEKALADARQFAADGKYEQALERHVWYHQNALAYAPAHLGVRLSFALLYWVDLGKVYPEALLKLEEARDHALAIFRKAPSDERMFSEAMSLNLALDDWTSSKALFYEGAKHGVAGNDLASKVDHILELGDIEWARDVIGDPFESLREARKFYEMSCIACSDDAEELESMVRMYSKEMVRLVRSVASVHGMDMARQVQAKVLEFLNNPTVRGALDRQ